MPLIIVAMVFGIMGCWCVHVREGATCILSFHVSVYRVVHHVHIACLCACLRLHV